MNKKDKIKNYRKTVAERLFNSRCFVCHKKFGKGFGWHHIKYKKNEKIYSNFKSSLTYQLYILPIIEMRPDDFRLLCRGHHRLTEILKRFKPERFERLTDVVRESTRDIR